MRDTELLRGLLRVEDPWDVTESKLDLERSRVDVRLEWRGPGRCPTCSRECAKHDHRERVWRDLDLCGDQLFTERFERIAIALLREMSVAAVARRMAMSWDQVDAVMLRAVERGRSRQRPRLVRHIGIDEKAVKKRHRYFTIVSDLDAGVVLWVGRGRKRESIDAFWSALSREQLEAVEGVAMDMWQPYFDSTMAYVPNAASKIVFDRFHVTAYLTKAVDFTRRAMMRDRTLDRTALRGTKYSWLRSVHRMDRSERRELSTLRHQYKALGRAWAIKEHFTEFWRYRRESSARNFFRGWFHWATHHGCRS